MRQSEGNRALYKLPNVVFSSEANDGRSGGAGTPLARIRSPLLLKTTSLTAGRGELAGDPMPEKLLRRGTLFKYTPVYGDKNGGGVTGAQVLRTCNVPFRRATLRRSL